MEMTAPGSNAADSVLDTDQIAAQNEPSELKLPGRRPSLNVAGDVVDEILDSGEEAGDEELFNVRTVEKKDRLQCEAGHMVSHQMLLQEEMPKLPLFAGTDADEIVEEQVGCESNRSETEQRGPNPPQPSILVPQTLEMNGKRSSGDTTTAVAVPPVDLANTEARAVDEELDVEIDESEQEEEIRAVNVKPPRATALAQPILPEVQVASRPLHIDCDEEVGEEIASARDEMEDLQLPKAEEPLLKAEEPAPSATLRKPSLDRVPSQCNSSIGGDSEAYEDDFDDD